MAALRKYRNVAERETVTDKGNGDRQAAEDLSRCMEMRVCAISRVGIEGVFRRRVRG